MRPKCAFFWAVIDCKLNRIRVLNCRCFQWKKYTEKKRNKKNIFHRLTLRYVWWKWMRNNEHKVWKRMVTSMKTIFSSIFVLFDGTALFFAKIIRNENYCRCYLWWSNNRYWALIEYIICEVRKKVFDYKLHFQVDGNLMAYIKQTKNQCA